MSSGSSSAGISATGPGSPTSCESSPSSPIPNEPLRVVVYRMAEASVTRFPVVDRADPRKLIGMISLSDLLAARTRNLDEERRRERVLRIHLPFPARKAG